MTPMRIDLKSHSFRLERVAFQSVKKLIFDRLAEVKGASKTNNSLPSAYRWYVRERVVQ